ncbi:MAG: phosphatase PAP2 family protein [Rhizobiaceae bacterium]|nr:phosphatase PAP2 family protein [Rhizobiaceae bacterium]MCV0404692.1 phosphatase PAP2 family protein [Rhizobiaceae bacterium]
MSIVETTQPQRPVSLRAGTVDRIRADRPLHVAILAYGGMVMLLLHATGTSQAAAFASYVPVWSVAFFFVFPVLYAGWRVLAVVHRVDRRRRLAWRAVFPAGRIDAMAAGVPLLATLMVFQGAFTSFKAAMPIWRGGFVHDAIQADIDRFLHMGVDPWRWLFSLSDAYWLQRAVEISYSQIWFVFCFGFLFWVVVSPAAAGIRTRYLVAYVATWIVVGNLLALVFLSAGPAYFGLVTGDHARFAEQLAILSRSAGVAHSAVELQAYLWASHEGRVAGLGTGISAFPSMHVALATLNMLFLWERSRRWGMIAAGYLLVVLASSVYLAWHYAIDGYAAIALVAAIHFGLRAAMKPALKAS